MNAALVFVLILLCLACAKKEAPVPVAPLVTCDDGRKVINEDQCRDSEPVPSSSIAHAEPDLIVVNETKTAVLSGDDAREAFDTYAENSSFTFLSQEQVMRGGTVYYRIKYRTPKNGGTNAYVIIDSEGTVYQELGKI